MAINYSKLFFKLEEEGLNTKQLEIAANISGNIITRIRRNQYISLESIEKICQVLECGVDQIMEFRND